MNVEALQMFNPCAIALNAVPTVNLDRSALQKVLPYAPENPVGNYFSTHSMNVTDKILSAIGDPHDGLGSNCLPVERIAHNFHMMDL